MRAIAIAVLCATLAAATSASAQGSVRLDVGGCSCDMGNNTLAEYTVGTKVSATGITYTVTIVSAAPTRITSIYVRANAATMSNGKSSSECEWRRSDLAAWNPLTTSNVLIETRTISGTGTTWNNSIFVRCSLNWVNDPPGTQAVGLTFTMQIT